MGLGPVELVIILLICILLLIVPVALAVLLARRTSPARRRAPCPYCAEAILPQAAVCRFCGRELPADWARKT